MDEGSFWDPEFYKKTTKKVEDGFKLCGDFISMLEERADIEKNYAKNLQCWAKKWQETVIKGPEQGDMEKGWLALVNEALRLSDIHQSMRQGLEEYVIENIKLWSKESYHKGLVTVKEKKDLDEHFKRVQKPWASQLSKVKKCKNLYFDACRNERKAKKFKENGTLALSEEHLKKIDERIQRTQEEALKSREGYVKSIEELDDMAPKYVDEMRSAFSKCQLKESQRLNFFTETLVKIHRNIDISQCADLSKIYQQYINVVENLDHDKDLLEWSLTLGDNMPFKPPKFEEFFEVVEPAKKGNSLLRSVMHRDNSVYRSTTMPKSCSSTSTASSTKSFLKSCSDSGLKNKKPIRVRALYDYVANAADELSLKEGEEFDKLEDEDELGWSKGLKDGKIGLYPANYVDAVQPK